MPMMKCSFTSSATVVWRLVPERSNCWEIESLAFVLTGFLVSGVLLLLLFRHRFLLFFVVCLWLFLSILLFYYFLSSFYKCFFSVPALDVSPTVPATVVFEAVNGPKAMKTILFWFTYVMIWFFTLIGSVTGKGFRPQTYFGFSKIENDISQNVKKLFLYSEVDTIANAKLLREYISKIGGKGFDFGDSKHVQHFRKYPHLYRQQIEETFFKDFK
jgi:hypothetical protein